jgi:hypothetical protein
MCKTCTSLPNAEITIDNFIFASQERGYYATA